MTKATVGGSLFFFFRSGLGLLARATRRFFFGLKCLRVLKAFALFFNIVMRIFNGNDKLRCEKKTTLTMYKFHGLGGRESLVRVA